jgi:uncharacterized membrane protein
MEETNEKKEEGSGVSQSAAPTSEAPKDKDVEENKLVAALSYLGVLVAVPLFLKRESPYCQFHAKQGLALLIVWIVGSVVFWFPLIGWAAALVVLVLNIIGLVKALQGEKWEMPIIGDLAKKINI